MRNNRGCRSCTWRSTRTTGTGHGRSAHASWTARRCASPSTSRWCDSGGRRCGSCGAATAVARWTFCRRSALTWPARSIIQEALVHQRGHRSRHRRRCWTAAALDLARIIPRSTIRKTVSRRRTWLTSRPRILVRSAATTRVRGTTMRIEPWLRVSHFGRPEHHRHPHHRRQQL